MAANTPKRKAMPRRKGKGHTGDGAPGALPFPFGRLLPLLVTALCGRGESRARGGRWCRGLAGARLPSLETFVKSRRVFVCFSLSDFSYFDPGCREWGDEHREIGSGPSSEASPTWYVIGMCDVDERARRDVCMAVGEMAEAV
eukprot:2155691-Prymnesium_polylepis.1